MTRYDDEEAERRFCEFEMGKHDALICADSDSLAGFISRFPGLSSNCNYNAGYREGSRIKEDEHSFLGSLLRKYDK